MMFVCKSGEVLKMTPCIITAIPFIPIDWAPGCDVEVHSAAVSPCPLKLTSLLTTRSPSAKPFMPLGSTQPLTAPLSLPCPSPFTPSPPLYPPPPNGSCVPEAKVRTPKASLWGFTLLSTSMSSALLPLLEGIALSATCPYSLPERSPQLPSTTTMPFEAVQKNEHPRTNTRFNFADGQFTILY